MTAEICPLNLLVHSILLKFKLQYTAQSALQFIEIIFPSAVCFPAHTVSYNINKSDLTRILILG